MLKHVRLFSLGALCVALTHCGACQKGPAKTPGELTTNSPRAPLKLEPTPEAPAIDVAPETLPGADGALVVVSSRPQGEMMGEVRPTITFSKPVKMLEDVDAPKKANEPPVAVMEPALEGEWKWLGSATVEFVPRALVPYSTPFKVTVLKGLRAIDGSVLKDDFSFTFSTPKLELQSSSPVAGDRWLKADSHFTLLFNQPVASKDLEALASLSVEGESAPRQLKVLKRVGIAEERAEAEKKAGVHPQPYDEAPPEVKGTKNWQTRYELATDKPLPLGVLVKLTLPAGLHGEQGPITMGTERTLKFRTYGPLRVLAVACHHPYCPNGPFSLATTNAVDVQSLRDHLTIAPAVEIDWPNAGASAIPRVEVVESKSPDAWMQASVFLPGKFKPGVAYTLTLSPGTRDVFGQVDSQAFVGTVTTSDLHPRLWLGGDIAVIEARADAEARLPAEVTNLSAYDVQAWRLSPPEIARVLLSDWHERPAALRRPADATETTPLSYPRNAVVAHAISLKQLFSGKPTGIAYVSLTAPELPRSTQTSTVQVTDLAAHLKLGPTSSLVWVTRLSTSESVAGASVTLLDRTGSIRWTGKTDALGVCDVPGVETLKLPNPDYEWDAPRVVAVVQQGEDMAATASGWESGVEAWQFGIGQAWEGNRAQTSGLLFADRGIYRPGDTAHVKGVIRFRRYGQLKLPQAGSDVAITVTDSKGKTIASPHAKTTAYGTFALDVALPADGATGYYSVDAKTADAEVAGSFRVEEYRAPQFKVDVETPQKELLAGDAFSARAFGRYLFGGAMSGAKVKWASHRASAGFSASSSPDFNFNAQTWTWDDGSPEPVRNFFASGEGVLDKSGALPIAVGSVEAPQQHPWTYVVEAEVTDVNRQTVANRVDVTVHPAEFYVGLRSTAGFLNAGSASPLEVVVVNTKGERVVGRAVDVVVRARTWKSVKKKDATGGFSTVSEPDEHEVQKCALKSDKLPVACQFKPPESGFYIATATTKDDKGRTHSANIGVYSVGAGFVAWQRNDTDRVELVLDKPSYAVGDVAKILVKSPYQEANLLFTLEREGVLERRAFVLKGSVQTLEVPITEAMAPNVFAGVVLVHRRTAGDGIETGDDPNRPNARVGLITLPVELKTRRLAVDVKTDKEEYRPGQNVTVSLSLKDSEGKAADGEVTVYAVDEAVLRLTDYQRPDPIAAIFPRRGLSVRLGEPLLHLVRQRSYGEKGEDEGGGGGDDASQGGGFRANFKTTAFWSPTLVTSGGKATASFKLPDNLTTFRLMAVAVTTVERFGSGETSFRVAKPLLALPALPRFARVGDTFEAGVVVHTLGAGSGDVAVSAEVTGATLVGAAEKKVAVTAESPREVRFTFKAEKPGPARFRFKVARGADSDGVEQTIPLELPVAVEAVATYGDTTDQRVEGVVPPNDVMPELGGLSVSMSSTALGNFDEGFKQLIEYPYGCLEQQSSRLVPLLALREISGQFGIPWPGPDEKKQAADREVSALLQRYLFSTLDLGDQTNPDAVIRRTVRSIESLQNPDGSFRYWPTAWCANSSASVYATMSLARARDVGFSVSPEVLSKAEGFLGQVAVGRCAPCELSCPDETRVFAAYVLARIKKPKVSVYEELYSRRAALPLFSRALLVNAMYVGGGDRKKANALMTEIMNFAKESAKGIHFEEVQGSTYATLWHSDTRTTGAVLQALTDVAPSHPHISKMAHYLTGVRQGDGRWRSTQEAAWSLMALTEVLRTKEKDVPNFNATVAFGDATAVAKTFKGRSLAVETRTVPMAELLAQAKGEAKKLTFAKSGPGVLYYSALLRYAHKQMPTTPSDQGLFVQRWFEPYEGGGQAKKFNAGDLVRVRLRVGTRQERHWTAFEIPLPAGLEPVDTTLASTAKLTRAPTEESRGVEYDPEGEEDQVSGSVYEGENVNRWAYGFWSPFNHVEQRDSKVVLFADHLPPGVHTSSFVARATTPGTFVLKPARGELMYEPEVWGRSEGGTFEVALPVEVTSR